MKRFTLSFLDETIGITIDEHYQLEFPDQRWMVIAKYPDDTKTEPVENENISYSTAFVWVVESQSSGPEWLNHEQLQALGEMIRKKEQEIENG